MGAFSSKLQQTNTTEKLLDDDGEIGKVTISDNEALSRKRKKKRGIEERKELSKKVFLQFVLKRCNTGVLNIWAERIENKGPW